MTGLPLTPAQRDHLRAAMKRKNLTQQALADAIGSHQVTIARVLSGEKNPSETLLSAIAAALGLGEVRVETRVKIG